MHGAVCTQHVSLNNASMQTVHRWPHQIWIPGFIILKSNAWSLSDSFIWSPKTVSELTEIRDDLPHVQSKSCPAFYKEGWLVKGHSGILLSSKNCSQLQCLCSVAWYQLRQFLITPKLPSWHSSIIFVKSVNNTIKYKSNTKQKQTIRQNFTD